jgi:PIN domain nuclease of toxin-antitoxin system
VRLLLDTHALLWWLAEPERLSPVAHAAIADGNNQVLASAASGWEIATKARLGKLPAASELVDDLPHLLAAQGFELLPITLRHGLHAGGYAMPHRDPFDRLLAAQAELDRLTLVSLDPALQAFPCRVLW